MKLALIMNDLRERIVRLHAEIKLGRA